ncbi:peptidase S8/S53 domain-containing protein, partial [Dunaliella salina]
MRLRREGLYLILLASLACWAHEEGTQLLVREARLGQRTVWTHGLQREGEEPERKLLSVTRGAPVVFLLGYDPATKAAVSSMLTSMGISILQPVPTDHWLVRGTPAGIRTVQERFPSVTSSLVPKQVKTSERTEQLLQGVPLGSKKKGRGKSHPTRVLLPGAPNTSAQGRSAQNAGDSASVQLQDLKQYETLDGRPQFVLDVSGPALTTVHNAFTDSPERQAAKAEAEDWAQELRGGLAAFLALEAGDACQPMVQSVSVLGTLSLVVCAEHARDATSWLAEQDTVISIGLKHKAKLLNLHASATIQNGPRSSVLPDDFASKPQLFPIWQAGITGEGQLVGFSDSGIDMGSCYFWDPTYADYQDNPDNIKNTADKDGVNFEHFFNTGHRKVTSYYWFRNTKKSDDSGGHGTHVGGTIAGAAFGFDPISSPDLATGVAPKAKLTLFDISEENGGIESLVPPGGCLEPSTRPCNDRAKGSITSIYGVQHEEGARISSNSWGTTDRTYTNDCVEIDAFARQYDMLILFAAGNDGASNTAGALRTGTVGAPATCKNVLAIGAADNWRSDFGDSIPDKKLLDANGDQVTVNNLADIYASSRELHFYSTAGGGARSHQFSFTRNVPQYFEWGDGAGLVDGLGVNEDHE